MVSMQCIHRLWPVVALAALTIGVGACGGTEGPDATPRESSAEVPKIVVDGSRAIEYRSLDQLAEEAVAVAVIESTGNTREVPLPVHHGGTEASAPTVLAEVRAVQLIDGELQDSTVLVVTPGQDQNGREVLTTPGETFVAFLTPALYGPGDPVGGYAIVGGPAGIYAESQGEFHRIDEHSPSLPATITAESFALPTVGLTEAEAIEQGPVQHDPDQ